MVHKLYRLLSKRSAPALRCYLNHRIKRGKEDAGRIDERYGIPSAPRPDGKLIWIHAASVGEAQAALILLNQINTRLSDSTRPPHILVTTGTQTSAQLMEQRLPDNATHQYIVLDHPDWVRAFFDHWRPNMAFWMESELWPNILKFIKKRHIPCALINARMSKTSFRNWKKAKGMARNALSAFDTVLCQTETHKEYFEVLGAQNVIVTDNLKYSATALPYGEKALKELEKATKSRSIWLYASSHKGEESLTCDIHKRLKQLHPDILTILVPRHPERRTEIEKDCDGLVTQLRSKKKQINKKTEIYIADTLGELGLFYKVSDIAVIGRSFSDDGGGGHNPLEASLLDCAVITGPNHQNQQEIFDDMLAENAAIVVNDKDALYKTIQSLMDNEQQRKELIKAGASFAKKKANVINHVMDELEPLFLKQDMLYI